MKSKKEMEDGGRGRKDGEKEDAGTRNEYWKWSYSCLEDELGKWGEREKGRSPGELRNIGINWRKIEAAENGRRRGKGACCLIFNRIISSCFPFIYLIFFPPHIYSYVNFGYVPAENRIGVLRCTEPTLWLCITDTHAAILGNPKGISVDLCSPAAGSDTGRAAADSRSYRLTMDCSFLLF